VPLLVLIAIALTAGGLTFAAALRYPHGSAGATSAPIVDAVAETSRRHATLRRWIRARRDPRAATGLALSLAFLVTVAGGLVIGLFAILVRSNDTLLRVDTAASEWGFENATGFTDAAIEAITQLGDTWVVAVAGLVLVGFEWWRRPNRFVLPYLLVVVVGDKLVTTGVKELADRARPTLNPIAETLGPSFPSGHSSTAAAFFAGAALVLGRGYGPRGRAAFAAAAVAIAVGVACSRVLLGVHWLSDVVAGLALGWGWFALCTIAFGGRLLTFGVTATRIRGASRSKNMNVPRAEV
jgi:undecaprenyl-diphosphatase